jgi:hypothetical protein
MKIMLKKLVDEYGFGEWELLQNDGFFTVWEISKERNSRIF